MRKFFETTGGCLLAIVVIGFGLFQIGAGWAGIEDQWGWGWGLAAVIAALTFRFTIPIVVGCFLCAHNIWDWHWFFAVLFAAPGLVFMIPAFVTEMIAGSRQRFG